MQRLRIHFDPVDAPQTIFDRVIEWILIALLAFCPLTFGAVHAWSEGIFELMVALMAICLAIKQVRRRDARFVISWVGIPIALFVLLIVFQLIPFPVGMVRALSPNTVALKTRLLADLPDAASSSMTLTFYTEATLRQLRLVLAVASLFVIVINVFQRVETIRRLLLGIAIIGMLEAILSIAQVISGATKIYWVVSIYNNEAHSGSFVNHSHFGQFMNLSIGAAMALLLLAWHTRGKDRVSIVDVGGVKPQPAGWDGNTIVMVIALVSMASCIIALLLSLTRGGVISMLIAGSFSLIVLRLKSPSRSKGVVGGSIVGMLVILGVAWIVFDQIYHRFASIADQFVGSSRAQIVSDLIQGWKQFPIFGTGLGTHPVIFPYLDRSQIAGVASHAENEYAQMLLETGAAGMVMIVAMIALVWWNYARAMRGRFSSISALAIGLGYGFAAILIHSLSDFGQHLPANAALTSVTCGLLVSLSRLRARREADTQIPQEFSGNLAARVVACAVVSIACIASLWQAQRVWAAEKHWLVARDIEENLRKRDWPIDNEAYPRLIIEARSASDLRPGNVEYAYWLPVYRWKWISLQRDEEGQFPKDAEFLGYARRIVDELHRVRRSCPTYGLPISLAGQIEHFVLHDPHGADHIRLGSELNRNDPTTCFVDGQLAAAEGDWERSLECMRRYDNLSPGGSVEVVELYTREFHRPDMALRIAEGDVESLLRLVYLMEKSPSDAQLQSKAKQALEQQWITDAQRDDAGPNTLLQAAKILAERGQHAQAIPLFRRSFQRSNTDLANRFELAKSLLAMGKRPEAIEELKLIVNYRPDLHEAEKLLKQLDPQTP